MRSRLILCGIALCCCYSEAISAMFYEPEHSGKFLLDQSKDVFFEEFSDNDFNIELLQKKDKFENKSFVFGGMFQSDFQHWRGDRILTTSPAGFYHIGTGFYLNQLTCDIMTKINNWSTLFFSGADSHIAQGPPSGNYIYTPRSFLLLGDLKKDPIYFSIGINSIPFGVFTGSGMWDSPLTEDYFKPQQAPQINVGFIKNNFNVSATYFNDEINHKNSFVYNLYYNNTEHALTYSIGAGYISHLDTSATGNPTVRRKVGFNMGNIYNLNASLGYKILTITGEYLLGSAQVGINRASSKAFGFTLSVAPKLSGKETTFGLSHSKSLYLRDVPTTLAGQDNVPLVASGLKNSWAASVSRSIFGKNLTLGFDIEKDTTYLNHHTYTATLDLLVYF